MEDWAKFALFNLQRKPGIVLKQAASFEKLNTTIENGQRHGLGGWLVQDMKQLGGHCLQMTGSNTMWFALLWIISGRKLAVVVATNSGASNAFTSCDQVVAALIEEFFLRP
jgi:CubicO group peptidase (beta-lactamase class C family)